MEKNKEQCGEGGRKEMKGKRNSFYKKIEKKSFQIYCLIKEENITK